MMVLLVLFYEQNVVAANSCTSLNSYGRKWYGTKCNKMK
ncbi:hypothetical protein SAMN04515679_0066 [Pelosinus fermentans]|uniref:Uncharacterized protein n=1 Tax=Pelosinus fermentans B4 TaxID=1149862 RepID=I8RHP9_9FIRM|nr:hypothetical protein FB4_4219 [Pelosinus fermentans B4]EIW23530.1 hypothetical protein FA11_4222 [Pelosinus fermentans A11]OAM92025.1 hypothetical protein FR7_00039 [Pelosinus fermentans DSM 17108]SDQ31260.1 hypothetical protein SAMN04515679_0066 [Pelosinus fermentans]